MKVSCVFCTADPWPGVPNLGRLCTLYWIAHVISYVISNIQRYGIIDSNDQFVGLPCNLIWDWLDIVYLVDWVLLPIAILLSILDSNWSIYHLRMVCYPIQDDSPQESVAFASPTFHRYPLNAVQHPQVPFWYKYQKTFAAGCAGAMVWGAPGALVRIFWMPWTLGSALCRGAGLAGWVQPSRARSRWMIVRDWLCYIWSSMLQILCCSGRESVGWVQPSRARCQPTITGLPASIWPYCPGKSGSAYVTVYLQRYWCIMNTLWANIRWHCCIYVWKYMSIVWHIAIQDCKDWLVDCW